MEHPDWGSQLRESPVLCLHWWVWQVYFLLSQGKLLVLHSFHYQSQAELLVHLLLPKLPWLVLLPPWMALLSPWLERP